MDVRRKSGRGRRHESGRNRVAGIFAVAAMIALWGVLPFLAAGQATPDSGSGESSITVAGSATLGPVVEAAADAFAAESPGVTVDVERSSSGAGIERFCAGKVDLATSGRTIREEEAVACGEIGVDYLEFEVAFDGVAIVVNPDNEAVSCVTVDQLRQMWEPGSSVASWSDVDGSWPDEPLSLYGMGAESGTYQFFTQATVGEEGASRDDYTVTEGHPQTAEEVAGDPNGLGFLPFPRYLENQESLKLLEVDGGSGCIAPDPQTIQDGSYAPLSRPMYLYVSTGSLERTEVRDFLTFWFVDAQEIAESGGLVPSAADVYEANLAALMEVIGSASTPQASPAASS